MTAITVIPGTTNGIIGMDRSEFVCGGYDEWTGERTHCTNPFFEALQRTRYADFHDGGWFGFTLFVAALLVAAVVLVTEWLIARRPRYLRCRCRFHFLKRFCPLPKTADEAEKMDGHAWDRVRLWYYHVLVWYFALAVGHHMVTAAFFISSLGYLERQLPTGMSLRAKMDSPFLVIAWGNVAVTLVAFVCVLVRWGLTRGSKKSWMEGHGVIKGNAVDEGDAEEQIMLGEENVDGAVAVAKYTDADLVQPQTPTETA